MSLKIIVASKNPVKINAATAGFKKMFPHKEIIVEGISVPSGVADQPLNNQETLQGATNRAKNAADATPEADFWIGIEGGIDHLQNEMEAFAWVVIKSLGKTGKSRTSSFFLPQRVKELIIAGKELGEADDIVFGKSNSKQQNGAVGILTNNIIDRTSYYTEAVVLALIPFKNPTLY